MKRLLRKAIGDDTTLYHGTSAATLLKIIADGQLDMSGLTNVQWDGGEAQYRATLPEEGKKGHKQQEVSLYDLRYSGVYSCSSDLYDNLNKKINEIQKQVKQENPDLGWQEMVQTVNELTKQQTIPVVLSQRHGKDSNAVFLGTEEKAEYFAKSGENHEEPVQGDLSYLDFGVVLKVEVDKAALDADYNDTTVDANSDEAPWQQTLDKIGQCVHYGPVYTKQITGVKFLDKHLYNEHEYEGRTEQGYHLWEAKAPKVFEEQGIKFDTWMSLTEAQNAIETLREHIQNADYNFNDGGWSALETALDEAGVEYEPDDESYTPIVTNFPVANFAAIFQQVTGTAVGEVRGVVTEEGDVRYGWGVVSIMYNYDGLNFYSDGTRVEFEEKTHEDIVDFFASVPSAHASEAFAGLSVGTAEGQFASLDELLQQGNNGVATTANKIRLRMKKM